MTSKIFSASHRALLAAAVIAWPALASSANLIVNNGFENNPPPEAVGNKIGWSIAPWVLGTGATSNVVTVKGDNAYGSYGPNLDAERTLVGTFQRYLDISGGNNTVSQTFTVPTCGATDTTPRVVDFSGYFSVRDSINSVGSGYIRIVDKTVLDSNGLPTELKKVDFTSLGSTNADGVKVDPSIQTWKLFGDSVAVTPGHQITYEAYITNNLNFDNAYMAFRDFTCPSTTLAMAKQWNGAPSGHTATLTATRDNGATEVDRLVSTANGSPSQFLRDDSPFTVFAGDKTRISETLSNTGSTVYSQSFSCTGDTTVTPVNPGVYDVEVGNVSMNTEPIVCTMVNTNTTQSTLKLSKQWNGAQEGDTATLTATALSPVGAPPLSLTSIATSLAQAPAGQLQSGLATVVPDGASFTLSETITNPGTTPAAYASEITCTGAQRSGQTITLNAAPGTQAECTISNTLAALSIQKLASAPADTNGSGVTGDAGDEITYTFTVQNTGRADLANVQINDAMLLAANTPISWSAGAPPATLSPNASATATAVYTITAADVAHPAGVVTNTATASAKTVVGASAVTSAPDTATVPVKASHPSLTISKTASVADTNQSGLLGDAGDIVTYQFVVTNTGDTRLTGVEVLDPLPGLSAPTFTAWPQQPGTLEVNDTVTATATYTIQAADVVATKIDNRAQAKANPLGGVTPTAQSQLVSTPTVAPQPKLAISKAAVVADTNASGLEGDAGDVISYTITVSNVGDVPLSGVGITDPLSGLSTLSIQWPDPALPGMLTKGAKAVATATYTIQAADVGAGQVVNTASAHALPVAGVSVTEVSDSASIATKGAQSLTPTPVPALGAWGLAVLSSLLVVIGLTRNRRHST